MKNIKVSDEDIAIIETIISYYNRFKVERINKRYPGFVEDDFTKLLKMLERILEV